MADTKTKTELMDEADIISANERLTAENTKLKADLAASTALASDASNRADKQQDRADKAESDLVTARAAADAAEKRAVDAEAKAEAAVKAKAEADTKMADFNKAVAVQVAKMGIRHEATETPAPKAGEKPKTLTEQILDYHGVKTLAELESKSAQKK